MAIGDILRDVGEGVKTGARVAGAVAAPLGKAVAEEEAGYAPQIAAEKRQQQQKLEDAQIDAKAQELENQMALGQKYGTLTPDQQQQYVDAITNLYSHPRHAPTLMEKLRKAIHPNGAYAQGPTAPLANAVPTGGTAEADEKRAKDLYDSKRDAARQNNPKLVALDKLTESKYGTDFNSSTPEQQGEALQTYVRESTKGSVGKSPPVPGTQLPSDATGPDGQPIGAAARDAAHSFVEYNGSWWPVAKPKPTLTIVRGHEVLIDPQSKQIVRDFGPRGAAKVTSRQTLQPGDDGQMHLVTLTSVTTPEGATIEVQPEGETPQVPQQGNAAPKANTPAKRVGSILPHTGARPVHPEKTSSAPVVPGLSTLANHKLQSNQDKQVLESSKQIVSSIDDLLPILEKKKDDNNIFDLAKQRIEFEKYKHGIAPDDPAMAKMFENSALLGVIGAAIWSRLGRSRYTFEVIQQHLPHPTDSPKLMYDKVKWLKDNVVPAAQDAIKNPQPDATPTGNSTPSNDPAVDKFLKSF